MIELLAILYSAEGNEWQDTPCETVTPNTRKGYRLQYTPGRGHVNAARLALETRLGRPLRPDYDPDHLCLNKACVNPLHLEEVTHAENSRRRHVKASDAPCPRGHVGQFRTHNTRGHRLCVVCEREVYQPKKIAAQRARRARQRAGA